MFGVLRSIATIATAFVLSTWFPANGQSVPDFRTGVVLEAMPERPQSSKRPLRPSTYRTPFIIPISPPVFGRVDLDEVDARLKKALANERPSEPPQSEHESFPLPTPSFSPPNPPLASSIASIRIRAIPASDLTVIHGSPKTRSKTVSVAGPNVRALGRQIDRLKLSVVAVEDQLRTANTWQFEELAKLAKEIKSLQSTRELLGLYWELLDERKQTTVGNLPSTQASIELLRQRIFETQVALDATSNSMSAAQRSRMSKQLDALTRELETIR